MVRLLCALCLVLVAKAVPLHGRQRVFGPAHETVNITVYRITPRNYTGVTNMNTGNAPGDTFFGFYELSFPVMCANQTQHEGGGFSCKNIPILDIPGFNVYTEFVVEADTRFGDYAECNPDPDNGTFICTHWNFGQQQCWYDNPEWAADFADLCDQSQCVCDVVETLSVGKEFVPFGRQTMNTTYPPACAANFRQEIDSTSRQPPVTTVFVGNDEGKCCDLCSSRGDSCGGYTLYNGTCRLFGNISRFDGGVPLPGALSGFTTTNGVLSAQIAQLAHNLNGTWYSTQEPGQCQQGQQIGVDCWWRVVEVKRNVNSSCVNNNMINAVIAKQPECFEGCEQPSNITSPCFIHCLFDTAAGNPYLNPPVAAMDASELVEVFVRSFASDDVSKGGCATVPPCPPPCKPPVEYGNGFFPSRSVGALFGQ